MATYRDLARRVERLARQRGHISPARLSEEVDEIRHIAHIVHSSRVEGLAVTLQSALSLTGMASMVLFYLDLIAEAIGMEIGQRAAAQPSAAPPPRG